MVSRHKKVQHVNVFFSSTLKIICFGNTIKLISRRLIGFEKKIIKKIFDNDDGIWMRGEKNASRAEAYMKAGNMAYTIYSDLFG